MRLKSSYTSAAARPRLVAYFIFGVRRTHCSRFSANGKRTLKTLVVSYHCFILTAKEIFEFDNSEKSVKFMMELPEKRGGGVEDCMLVGSFGKG